MTMITPSYLGETIEYSSLHACRSTLEDPTVVDSIAIEKGPFRGKGAIDQLDDRLDIVGCSGPKCEGRSRHEGLPC